MEPDFPDKPSYIRPQCSLAGASNLAARPQPRFSAWHTRLALVILFSTCCCFARTSALSIGELRRTDSLTSLTDGLFHSILVATREEWTRTFGNDAHNSGALHVWIKCLDEGVVLRLRAYTFAEPYDVDFGINAGYSVVNVSHGPLRLTVDGTVPVDQQHSPRYGGHFVTNRTASLSKDFEATLIGVAGWGSYFEFPLRLCAPPRSVASAHQNITHRIMHSLQWDVSTSNQGIIANPIIASTFVAAVRRHALFHACYAGVTSYELVVQESSLPEFLENSEFEKVVQTGLVRFMLKPPIPSFRLGKGVRWQALYQNLAVLHHWGNNVRLFMFDPDEFLFADHDDLSELDLILQSTSVVVLERVSVVHEHSGTDSAPDASKPFSDNWTELAEPLDSKLVIDPNGIWEVYVHHAIPKWPGMDLRVSKQKLRILHFPFFYDKRLSSLYKERERTGHQVIMTSVYRNCDPLSIRHNSRCWRGHTFQNQTE